MTEIGLAVPDSGFANTVEESLDIGDRIGYPAHRPPSYILGGGGTGIAHDGKELARIAAAGLAASPISEILIERCIAGWKEYELEVMRDRADNCVIVCSSRTSIPWACTPATRSPWPRPRPFPTTSTSACGTPLLPVYGASGWRRAGRTSSSPSTRDAATRWSSR